MTLKKYSIISIFLCLIVPTIKGMAAGATGTSPSHANNGAGKHSPSAQRYLTLPSDASKNSSPSTPRRPPRATSPTANNLPPLGTESLSITVSDRGLHTNGSLPSARDKQKDAPKSPETRSPKTTSDTDQTVLRDAALTKEEQELLQRIFTCNKKIQKARAILSETLLIKEGCKRALEELQQRRFTNMLQSAPQPPALSLDHQPSLTHRPASPRPQYTNGFQQSLTRQIFN